MAWADIRLLDRERNISRHSGARGLRVVGNAGEVRLTPAESRVAQMARAGCSNSQIASRLFVSYKTVECQLSRVYRKLGIARRHELECIDSRLMKINGVRSEPHGA
ncbi:helix-turn-helix transcriptional regulator [Streptomyces rubiginosohelvolus]|uniref:helix-turn-helix domain-containing protein n=1 Tax=Streptomyces rubiginosohelvolus TaxID=67362 RepID=UPI0036CAA1C3